MKLYLDDAIQLRKNRVLAGKAWLILPPFICSVLILLFINVISSFNEHASQKALLSKIKTDDTAHGGIRLTIFAQDEIIHIQQAEGPKVEIPASDLLAGENNELDLLLETRLRDIARSSVLSSRFSINSLFVTLAIDEQLSYAMIKPILRALAKAKLTRYGFEVRSPITLSQSPTPHRADHEEEH